MITKKTKCITISEISHAIIENTPNNFNFSAWVDKMIIDHLNEHEIYTFNNEANMIKIVKTNLTFWRKTVAALKNSPSYLEGRFNLYRNTINSTMSLEDFKKYVAIAEELITL